MVRFSRSHIRFGTFERLYALQRPDLIQKLLDHVITYYYPNLVEREDRYSQFYAELVERTAQLVAQWMSVGFCHAVLNTDNMSITGESFDYGPYAFINTYDLSFTAAYFDYFGRYSYGNQPSICYWNLEMLQKPLATVIPLPDMVTGLKQFADHYANFYRQRMLQKLGFEQQQLPESESAALLTLTLELLQVTQVGYHAFFAQLRQEFSNLWRTDAGHILSDFRSQLAAAPGALFDRWRSLYHRLLLSLPPDTMTAIAARLQQHNPLKVLVRPEIETVWEAIAQEDNWQPFDNLLQQIRNL